MNKEILRLAIPNIISNISVPLLSTVDTALMGHLSAAHLGAVGLSAMLFNFIYWNFGFLRMGTTGLTAQAYGAEDNEEVAAVLIRGLFLAILLAALIFILQTPIFEMSCQLLNVGVDQKPLVAEYFDIRIWGAPAAFGLFCLMGWFFGMQNAMIPLFITIVINVVNMAVSAYLVHYSNMGIKGVAIGTVIANYLGVLLAIICITWQYRTTLRDLSVKYLKDLNAIKGYLKINSDLFIRTVCLTFSFGFFYSMASKAGPMVLAVNVILQQFLNWMSYAVDGFAYASESLVGKYKGKKDSSLLIKAIKLSFVWGGVFALVFTAAYGLFGASLVKVFTKEIDVIQDIKPYLIWIAITPIFAYASYIWDGVFIGLTASKSMRNAMLLSLVVYLGAYYIGQPYLDQTHNLWLSLCIFLAARGLIQTVYFKKYGVALS